jgi:ribose/xylose/arabinose/galactoside ABC-type transport system permease subunit
VSASPPATSPSRAEPSASPWPMRFFQYFESLGVILLLLVVVVVASTVARGFFTYTNITNTIIIASITAVTGFGMTFAIAMGGFDLSVGSVQALTGIAAAMLLQVSSMPVAIVGALAVGVALGVVNGTLVAKLRMPAFVATFGMMSIVRGVALLVTKGQSVMITGKRNYAALNNGKVFGIPIPLLVVLAVFAVLYVLLKHTRFGRHACAIGGNRKAAIASGIDIERTTVLVFALVGLTAAVSGVMLSSQLLIVDGTLGAGFELQTIAISVLGGTSLSGGSGNLLGTLIASLLLATISSALNILKVEAFYQYLYLGLLLVLALYLDTLRRTLIAKSILGRR